MGYIDKFRSILYIKDSPQRIALSFAFGAFWGCSPLIGLHTIGAFFIAWLLGLNRFIAVAGTYITNPWTMIPIYTFSLWLGLKITGITYAASIRWKDITFLNLMSEIKGLIIPLTVGTLVFGAIIAIIGYIVVYYTIKRYRETKVRTGDGA